MSEYERFQICVMNVSGWLGVGMCMKRMEMRLKSESLFVLLDR